VTNYELVFPGLKKVRGIHRASRAKRVLDFQSDSRLIIFALSYPHFLPGTINPDSHLGQIQMLYVFGTFVPLIAVSVRRLHDTNRSGWWFLMFLIPLLNLILFFFFMAEDSQPGENRYGPNPKNIGLVENASEADIG
jgi:uncharacterized membrane protein YhaH (DUF805 family)